MIDISPQLIPYGDGVTILDNAFAEDNIVRAVAGSNDSKCGIESTVGGVGE